MPYVTGYLAEPIIMNAVLGFSAHLYSHLLAFDVIFLSIRIRMRSPGMCAIQPNIIHVRTMHSSRQTRPEGTTHSLYLSTFCCESMNSFEYLFGFGLSCYISHPSLTLSLAAQRFSALSTLKNLHMRCCTCLARNFESCVRVYGV